MRIGQRRPDLADDSTASALTQVCARDHMAQRAPAHSGGDEIGARGVAPVVEDRKDVGVLQPGHDLGLGFVGSCRIDHGDDDLSSHRRLVRPVGRSRQVARNHIAELVAGHGAPVHRQSRRRDIEAKRWELHVLTAKNKLEHLLRLIDAVDWVRSQRAHQPARHSLRQHCLVGAGRQKHLPAMGRGHNAGAAAQRGPRHLAARAYFDVAVIDCDA